MELEWLYLIGGLIVGFVVVSKLLGSRGKHPTAHERLREIEAREPAGVSPRQSRIVDGVPISGEVIRLIGVGRKVLAIKQLRVETGLGLSEAKAIVDKVGAEETV